MMTIRLIKYFLVAKVEARDRRIISSKYRETGIAHQKLGIPKRYLSIVRQTKGSDEQTIEWEWPETP